MNRFYKLGTGLLVGLSVCIGLPAGIVRADTEKYTSTDFAMNTVVSETLYTKGKDLNPQVSSLLKETEEGLLSWTEEESQIYQLNHSGGRTEEVSDELAGYLKNILQLSEDSGGAFDPTLGKVIRLWDIGGENPGIPEDGRLEALLKETGYEKMELDGNKGAFDPTLGKVIRLWDIGGENPGIPEDGRLEALLKETGYEKMELDGNKVTLKDGSTLDLGAVGKGIGCDLTMEFLKKEKDVSGMILNL